MTSQANSHASDGTPESPLDTFRWVLALIVLFSLFRYLHNCARLWAESSFIDFAHYYTFATVVGHRLNPFDSDAVSGVDAILQIRRAIAPANYPPLFYLLMLPWTLLPFSIATIVWLAMCQSCLVASICLCIRRISSTTEMRLTGLLFVALNYQPLMEDFALGQANLLLLFLATLAWYNTRGGNTWIAAAALAFMPFIKVQYSALLLLLWWAGHHRLARRALLLAGVGLGLSLVLLSLKHHLEYLRYLLDLPNDLYVWTRNLSVRATLRQLLEGYGLPLGLDGYLTLAWNLVFGVVLLRALPRRESPDATIVDWTFGLGVTAVLLLSPLTEEHHFVVLLLPITLLLLRMPESPRPRWLTPLFLGSVLLLGSRYSLERYPLFNQGPLSLLAKGKLLGIIGLACVLFYRLRESSPEGSPASPDPGGAGGQAVDTLKDSTSPRQAGPGQ